MSYRRFADCSVSEKLLETVFILLLCISYAFAMALIYSTIAPLDGKPGLSMEDIKIKYYGNRMGTMLEQALNGKMKDYHSKEEHETILAWVHHGADRAQFDRKIMPIINNTCVKCHNKDAGSGMPDLSSYEKVMELVKIDRGESFSQLVRVSHIHLFGLGMLFYLLGRIFLLTEIPVLLKRVMVVIPFLTIAMDIGSWWLTKYADVFAGSVIAGGALMGVSFAFQAFVSLYQIWLYKPAWVRERGNRRSERRG